MPPACNGRASYEPAFPFNERLAVTSDRTDEDIRFRASLRDFVEREVVPAARELDERGEFPSALFRRCAQNGYLGLRYPEAVGGSGADFVTFCVMAEELARGSLSLASAAVVLGLMGNDLLYRLRSPE